MDDAEPVRIPERVGDRAGDRDRIGDRELSLAHESLTKRAPFHEGEDAIELASVVSRIQHRQDARMLQPGVSADLTQKALGGRRLRQLVVQHLDRHDAAPLEVARAVDDGTRTASELVLDDVAASERTGDNWRTHEPPRREGRALHMVVSHEGRQPRYD